MNSDAQPLPISWRPVRDGVYLTTLEPASVNCGLVVGTTGVLLVDTGSSPAQGTALRESIAQISDAPLRAVVVTHHHWDHAYGLSAFADVETIGHESLAETLTNEAARTTAAEHGLAPDEVVAPTAPIAISAASTWRSVTSAPATPAATSPSWYRRHESCSPATSSSRGLRRRSTRRRR